MPSLRRRSAAQGSAGVIEFRCHADDWGVIAEPIPARAELPAWFRSLPGTDRQELTATNDGLTVKRCLPFLDAMTTGWLIPLAATVRLSITDDGKHVDAGWEFDKTMVSNHSAFQVAGNPFEPRPPMKFHNYWTVRTAPGWSCLFTAPLNRPDAVVTVFGGVVDTDTFAAPVNFPFVATGADGVHTLTKGTPIVQVIPFRRDDAAIAGEVGPETLAAESSDEATERKRIQRSIRTAAGWYRTRARAQR